MEDFIRTENLEFQYINEDEQGGQAISVDVLKGVSMEVKQGEFVALLGHNGSGKSTMAKQFNAMLLPMGGKVYVDGMDTLDDDKKYDIRRKVGLVLQNPDNQLVASIVEEDVAFGPENLGIEPAEIRRRVDSALKAVDMYEYRTHAPHKLSGGQKQRVAIARAMANDPAILLADEPTGALDSATGRLVMDLFHRLHREQGKTIVLITHSPELAGECQRIVTIKDGRVTGVRRGGGAADAAV